MQALKNVSLTIGKGMFGLLGQNGSGKSTLMKTIATLQNADQGTITFNGIYVLKRSGKMSKVLGYLPQEFGVYPNISAEELLLHIANMKGRVKKEERKKQVSGLLDQVNLYDVRKKYLNSYSRGMKQRFGIAQALIGNPQLIVVDEPTAGLDPIERNRFYNLRAEIGENKVVMLSTHIVEDASTLYNDMAIIGRGEVLLTGKPEEVEQSLRGKLLETPLGQSELSHYKEQHKVISQRFHQGKMMITVVDDEFTDHSFNQKSPSLEDAYFNTLFNQEISA
ncbi:MAG: ATP-binding cassette domain-containing protein [Bacteroidota bacterium]